MTKTQAFRAKKGTATTIKKRAHSPDSSDGERADKKAKGATSSTKPPAMAKDDEGNPYWEISGRRRLVVQDFKGSTLINIREYYTKDGKTLPGAKGISLPIAQFSSLIQALPEIERVLRERNEELPRPTYDGERKASVAEAEMHGDRDAETQGEDDNSDEDPGKDSKSGPKEKAKATDDFIDDHEDDED